MIDRVKYWLALAALGLLGQSAAAQQSLDYVTQIKPIFKSRCYACHGALQQQAGLRLDAGRLILQGGDSGAGIEPRDPDSSLLLQRVTAPDASERMPPEGEPLTGDQVDLLRRWIAAGAPFPDDEQPEEDPRRHWSFQPPQRPNLPIDGDESAAGHPIDAFINQELRQHELTPRPLANPATLLRRVYLDLIGLPPTREELRAFLADDSPTAYETVVDRLLQDPRHGERWGRHWMDIWRYSDWYGRRHVNDVRNSASQIWRWRDWIVRSLNSGKGYDRMVREMLAADEICPEDYDAGVATGYLIRNYYSLNANDWMRSTVEHTGKAFLGLTFNCAHCHDHKYDPIAQDDYFRLRAFFEPVYIRQDRVAGEADPGVFQDYTYAGTRSVQRLGAVRVFDKTPDAPTWFYTGGDERNRVSDRGSMRPGVPAFLAAWFPRQIEPVQLPPVAWYPGLRSSIHETVLSEARRMVSEAESELEKAPSASGVPEVVCDQLAEARVDFEQAQRDAATEGRPGALVGEQSLYLDATAGRRTLKNHLTTLQTLDEGATVSFQLLLLTDAHFNFQFVKDVAGGATATYVRFEGSKVFSFAPGSTSDLQVGAFDWSGGERRFAVTFELQPSQDRCLLTIRSVTQQRLVADRVPVALNGWNPVGKTNQVICFDARAGSRAVVDEFSWSAPRTEGTSAANDATVPLWLCTFESPSYMTGRDVTGIDGWESAPWNSAPAASVVSRTAANEQLGEKQLVFEAAQRAFDAATLPRRAVELRLAAAQAELASVEARIAADQARFEAADSGQKGSEVSAAAQRACQSDRAAKVTRAQADVLAHELALANAEALPTENANRAKEVDAAGKRLAAARTSLDKALTAASQSPTEDYPRFSPEYPQTSTGRRRALAEWITSRHNPLTARVAVNHIWSHHFHVPLVKSVYDFGRNGARPTHPALIDWLAVEFMESGWNMRHLHRLIVTSEAYRRVTSTADAQREVTADPENQWLWRMNTGRMEAEVVRDSLLYVAGELDVTIGGVELENDQALTTNRRSLYYSSHPEVGGKSALGELFDAPDPLDCYRRTSSIVPQQALALTNSELVHRMSTRLVEAWEKQNAGMVTAASDQPFLVEMFECILTRQPTDAELQICLGAMQSQRSLLSDTEAHLATKHARESLVRVLLNHNDFLTIR